MMLGGIRSIVPPEKETLAAQEAWNGPKLPEPLTGGITRAVSASWTSLVAAVSSAATIMSGISFSLYVTGEFNLVVLDQRPPKQDQTEGTHRQRLEGQFGVGGRTLEHHPQQAFQDSFK